MRLCALAFFAFGTAIPAYGQQPIKVLVNGRAVQFGFVKPHVIEGRVMVPLRGVLQRLGATVTWNPEDRSLTALRGDRDVYLPVGSRLAQVEGRPISLEAPARIVRGTIVVSLQSISESLGAEVTWDYKTQTVKISTMGRFTRGIPSIRPVLPIS
jgi:hypothetical protein